MRGRGLGLLGKREQHAHRVVGERAGGLRDEKGAGDAAPKRVGVVVGRCRAHPSVAQACAGALQRAVRGRAKLGDAKVGDDECLLGVAEREVAAVSGRSRAAALSRAVAEGNGGAVRRVALSLEAVEVRPVADDVGDVPGVDVREALPRYECAGGRPVATVAKAQLTGRVVGDAKAGQGGEEGTEAGGVAVAVV